MDWDCTYTELGQWAADTGANVLAHTSGNFKYEMDEQDFTAFKIKFKPREGLMNYKGITSTDAAVYYCPYIPIIRPVNIIMIDKNIT